MLVYNFLLSPINLNKLIKDKEYIKNELSNESNILRNPMNYFFNKNKDTRTTEPSQNEEIKNKHNTKGNLNDI